MRKVSTALYNLLTSKTRVNFFLLISLSYREYDAVATDGYVVKELNFTSAPRTINFGGKTYVHTVGLASYESPKYSSITEKGNYKISLIDTLPELTSYSLVGQPMTVRIGFYDESGGLLLSDLDVALGYSGFIDGVTKVNSFEEKIINLEGSVPMADLDAVNSTITSANSMDQVSLIDTSFDNIFTKEDVTIRWGKA